MAEPDIVLEVVHIQHQTPNSILHKKPIFPVDDHTQHTHRGNQTKKWEEHYPQLISNRIFLIVESDPLSTSQQGCIHNRESIMSHQPWVLVKGQSTNLLYSIYTHKHSELQSTNIIDTKKNQQEIHMIK